MTMPSNPRRVARRTHAAALHKAFTERLGSPTAAAVRLRALEQFARDHLPCRLAAAALCCGEGIGWLEARLNGDPAAFKAELEALMNRPDFWRDQDNAVVGRVRGGFDRLYPGP